MDTITLLINVQSFLFFVCTFPQFIRTYKLRKMDLESLSFYSMAGMFIAGIIFLSVAILTGAWLSVATTLVGTVTGALQIYWKVKAPKVYV